MIVALAGLLVSCQAASLEPEPAQPPALDRGPRDLDALMRVHVVPLACADDLGCPAGSACDDARHVCDWSCLSDDECGSGQTCNDRGACAASRSARISDSDPSCQAMSVAERLAALADLAVNPIGCPDDTVCPCGSFCDPVRFECTYECLVLAEDSEPLCNPGLACSPEGRCVVDDGTPEDPPMVADPLLVADVVQANTMNAAVLQPVEVRVQARDAAQLGAASLASVWLSIPESGTPLPRVRCASTAPLAESCELVGPWTFPTGSLISAPQTMWVELPQTAIAADWTLLATSEFGDRSDTLLVLARPVANPPSPTGRFTGTLTWAQPPAEPMRFAVDAVVTGGFIALSEPARLFLPRGNVVLSRDLSKTTLLSWLWTDTPSSGLSLQVQLDLGATSYDAASGKLTGTIAMRTGNGPTPVPLSFELRSQSIAVPSCTSTSCATGSYCNSDIGACLPGTSGSSIQVDDPNWVGYVHLQSELNRSWGTVMAQLFSSAAVRNLIGGRDVIGMLRSYCYQSSGQIVPQRSGWSTAQLSRDLLCIGAEQKTFPFVDRATAVVKNKAGTETFNLLDECISDLKLVPTLPYGLDSTIPLRKCASLGRFYAAMQATRPNYGWHSAGNRMATQLLREWLALQAYVSRGAVQEQEYDQVVTGQVGQPPATRLGETVDLVERDLRVLLDHGMRSHVFTGSDWQDVAVSSDHRELARPVLHYGFNAGISALVQDQENDNDLIVANFPPGNSTKQYLQADSAGVTCTVNKPISLGSGHSFSLVAYVAGGSSVTHRILEKTAGSSYFNVDLVNAANDKIRVTVSDNFGYVYWEVPQNAGFYAIVGDGQDYRLYYTSATAATTWYAPSYVYQFGPKWGPPGQVKIGCHGAKGDFYMIDEVSLWARPLALEEVDLLGKKLYDAAGKWLPQNDSFPARSIVDQDSDEGSQSLAVHLAEASSKFLELVAAYARAERDLMYGECFAGGISPARTRSLERIGRALRIVALLERDAQTIAALPGASAQPWFLRYQAAAAELVGKRAAVLAAAHQADDCDNPLGIGEDDLPLFHGQVEGASERFFATSSFLVARASEEVGQASFELASARTAWDQQRLSAFYANNEAAEDGSRIDRLEHQLEAGLRAYCGTPATGSLLEGFRSGAFTTTNCFVKSELPGCSGAVNQSIASVSPTCLRGQIGEQLLVIRGANIDAENARQALDREVDQYDGAMRYCTSRSEFHEETEAIVSAHNTHMSKLREQRRKAAFLSGFVKSMATFAIGGLTGNVPLALGGWLDGLGLILGQPEQQLAANIEDAEAQHALVMQARQNALDLMECFYTADNHKYAIDAATDVIQRADLDVHAALLRLDNLQHDLGASVTAALAEMDRELAIDRVPPQHHYWLDDHITGYRHHFARAQRLTYLALRALEYESQQSLGLRDEVLQARLPLELTQVIAAIDGRNAPLQGEQGFVPGELAIVWSLRDEILRIEDLAVADLPPGQATPTAAERLRAYLKSDAAKIYINGSYAGRGLRFSIKPGGWSENLCAERIWRVSSSISVDALINPAVMTLYQENTFSSQLCEAAAGSLQVARTSPHHNLLVGDAADFEEHDRYVATALNGRPLNKTREELESAGEGSNIGLANRGLYGNYVLLFPKGTFDNNNFLNNVKDVLLRFDIVEVTREGDPQ